MTDTPPTIPQNEPSKKGLSPLAWVGIGCGGLIVVALLVTIIGGILVGKKVQTMVDDAGGDPARFAAEMVVKMNPELELVEGGSEEGKLNIKVKETGEVISLSFEDIANGKFTMETPEGKVEVNAQDAGSGMVITQNNGETSVIKVDETGVNMQSSDGATQFTSGTGDAETDLPEWCSDFVYPQIAEVASGFMTTSGGKTTGAVTFTTTDSADEVAAFFREKFQATGYAVEEGMFAAEGVDTRTLAAKQDGRSITITAIPDPKGKTSVAFYHEASE